MSKSVSSGLWLKRQASDPYVLKARQMGYRSRAFFKLEEIDQKFQIFNKNTNVLDIGAAPGGWSQYAAKKLLPYKKKIFAVDILEMKDIDGVEFIRGDITQIDIKDATDNNEISVVMSDMAPNSCGHKQTDHLQMVSLCETVIDITIKHLANEGKLILKMWQGEDDKKLFKEISALFEKTVIFKPKASRTESRESYIIGLNFRRAITH